MTVKSLSVCDKPPPAHIPNMRTISFVQVAREMLTHQNQLEAEIEFWREMIATQDRSRSERALERMQQALALAERKLQLLEPTVLDTDSRKGDWTFELNRTRKEH